MRLIMFETITTRRLTGAVLPLILLSMGVVAHAQGIRVITPVQQKELLADTGTETSGAENPDVTIIEYFDYNCPFCRELAPDLQALSRDDHGVAVVYKEWPIFGGVSVYAAKAALAAGFQGKYLVAHETLIGGPRLAQEDQVDAELKGAGVDMDRLARDRASHAAQIDALLKRNDREAHSLNIRGTPGIVVDRQVLPGTVNLKGLKQLVEGARRRRQSP
jgi:protein-disulfide isomerase